MQNNKNDPQSYYTASRNAEFKASHLQQNIKTDICIIGAGYTGLSSALHLAEKGSEVVVLEAKTAGFGASGRNGGQVCSGFNKDPETLINMVGEKNAIALWQIAEEAKALVQSLINKHNIVCDYVPGILHTAYKAREAGDFAREVDVLNHRYQYKEITYVDKKALSQMLGTDVYHAGTLDKGAGHLHPLNYLIGMANAAVKAGVVVYENTPVTGYTVSRAKTDFPLQIKTAQGFTVQAKKMIFATNGYLGNLEKKIAPYIMPLNNFIIATEPLGEKLARELIRDNVAVADSKFVIDYYRLSADHRLIFGGGENYSAEFPQDIKSFVRKYMLRVFPQLEDKTIEYGWGGTLAITLNRLPDFGQLKDNIYYMQGFSGQGVALASYAGKLLAEKMHHPESAEAKSFELISTLTNKKFPGGTLLRRPGHILGMFYYAMKDKF